MMRMRLALIVVSTLGVMPAAAQWISYPTPGTPRTPDGKPNLTARAPRTRDGKPDLSDIWLTPSGRWLNNLAADGVEVPFRPASLAVFPKDLMADTELIEWMCENEKDLPHLVGK